MENNLKEPDILNNYGCVPLQWDTSYILKASNIKIEAYKELLPIKLTNFKDACETKQRKCLFSSLSDNKLMEGGGMNLMFWGKDGIFYII